MKNYMSTAETERLFKLLYEIGFDGVSLEWDLNQGYVLRLGELVRDTLLIPITAAMEDAMFYAKVFYRGECLIYVRGGHTAIPRPLYVPGTSSGPFADYPCLNLKEQSGFDIIIRQLAGTWNTPNQPGCWVGQNDMQLWVNSIPTNKCYAFERPDYRKLNLDENKRDDQLLGVVYQVAKLHLLTWPVKAL